MNLDLITFSDYPENESGNRAFLAQLKVGERCEVAGAYFGGFEMYRTVTSIEVRHEHGKDWLVWQWKKESQTPWGGMDCGFGGHVIDVPSAQQEAA